jgi:hypothetical protein
MPNMMKRLHVLGRELTVTGVKIMVSSEERGFWRVACDFQCGEEGGEA